jgi:o-succinylbenzoate synthase
MPEAEDVLQLRLFLYNWYSPSIWGNIRHRQPEKYEDMIRRRLSSLLIRRHDIAAVLKGCSPPLTSKKDWKVAVPSNTLFIAGGLDKKYSSIGRKWHAMSGISKYVELPNAGHALLVEEPFKISTIVAGFINNQTIVGDQPAVNTHDTLLLEPPAKPTSMLQKDAPALPLHSIGAVEYESFGITMTSADGTGKGVLGVGWGESARAENEIKRREGFIISLTSNGGTAVGIGEVSPLRGLHEESLQDVEQQLLAIKRCIAMEGANITSFHAESILSLDGSLKTFVDRIFVSSGIEQDAIAQSMRSGLEMAVLALSSQLVGSLLPQAIARHYYPSALQLPNAIHFQPLPINGLVTRGITSPLKDDISFPSIKVKVGNKNVLTDAQNLINVRKAAISQKTKLRADANRAWPDVETAKSFTSELSKLRASSLGEIEFIEEPLEKQDNNGKWSIEAQVDALEGFTRATGFFYALDESLVDLAQSHQYRFEPMASDLRETFSRQRNGCAAFVLKPAMLGVELCMQLVKLAQMEFHIPAIFSSSFDSGIGLSFTSVLAAVAYSSPFATELTKYSHGLGTFTMLDGDTLSPPFKSYVNKDGLLNVASLSRALYGLSLDEITDRLPLSKDFSMSEPMIASSTSETYNAATSSSTGRDITVSVSMPLPFSDVIASSRFTDLPQMSRWSPWLNSVTYLDAAGLTEWNLNIKGVKFSWRAQSELLNDPKGISWQSISGLRNSGKVEFEQVSSDSCIMRLKMSIILPYILVSLFQGMPSVVHDFLQNKLLKWSLEMFRDVVKADLALERGDNELGDALFGAVEGRANALEEALK